MGKKKNQQKKTFEHKQKVYVQNTINTTVNKRTFFDSGSRTFQKAILFLISVLIYSATVNFDYTLDDTLMITENNFTKQGFSGIKNIMTNDALAGFLGKGKNLLPGGRYRPLSHVLFAMEYEIFGLKKLDTIKNPDPQQQALRLQREKLMKITGHSINVILYALLVVLIYTVLLRLFKNREKPQWYTSISFIASLLFAVHPLHTEITCNIKNVDEIMSMMGSMAVLYFLLKYYDTRKIWLLFLTTLIFLLAILSKEDSLTFLAVVPLTFFVFTNANIKEHFVLFSPLLLGLILYFFIRYQALGFIINNEVINDELLNNPFVNTTFTQKLATVIYTWGIYLKLLFIPYPLTHDYYPYHIEITNFSNPLVILSALTWLFLIIYALINLKRKNIISYGILFFLITFSISSNLVINIGTFMNERFVFIPSLGFTIIISYLITEKLSYVINKNKYPVAAISTIVIIITLIFSIQTYARSFTWKDDYTLFTTDVKTSSNSAKCNVSAGGMIYHRALKESDMNKRNIMFNQAINYLEKGVRIHPTYIAGWLELGNVYLDAKRYSDAKAAYEKVLNINPKHPNALNNMLVLAQRTAIDSNYSYSNKVYLTLLKYKPHDKDYLYSLASNMLELHRIDTCKVILEEIIKQDSLYYKAYFKLGELYGRYMGNLTLSEEYFLKAYQLNQKDPSVLENLGIVYGLNKKYSLSIEFLNKALMYDPDNPRIYINLANTYYQMNNPVKAKEYIEKSKKLKEK